MASETISFSAAAEKENSIKPTVPYPEFAMVNICIRLPAKLVIVSSCLQVLEYGLVNPSQVWTRNRSGVWTRSRHPHRQCPVFISRTGRAVANSYTVHNIEPSALPCSRDVAFHATLQRGAASCHGQIAVLRVTARRGDPIHFALVVQRVGTQTTWSIPCTLVFSCSQFDFHEHRQSTSTQVPSQVLNHFSGGGFGNF